MSYGKSEIIAQMLSYIENIIEVPHPVFGGMPICPFSRNARLANKILYKVCGFSKSDLDATSELMKWAQNFSQQHHYELLLVIHPKHDAFTLEEIRDFTNCINQQITLLGLVAFDGHPEDNFNIQGAYTRQAPYIHFTLQFQHQVRQASSLLIKTSYYSNWTHQHLTYVGMPREQVDDQSLRETEALREIEDDPVEFEPVDRLTHSSVPVQSVE